MSFRDALLALSIIFAAGCSAETLPSAVPTALYEPPARSGPALDAKAQADAVVTGQRFLQAPGFSWVGTPQPLLTEQMTYARAYQRIGVGEPDFHVWHPETPAWLVIFRAQWDLLPMGPPDVALTPVPYSGCLLVLFTVRDSALVATGDAVCP